MFSKRGDSSLRVLVADDDPVIRRLITGIVEREGYTAVIAEDGRVAYRILQTDADFCGAIFDMMMPNLNGLEVIRYMRTEKRLMYHCLPAVIERCRSVETWAVWDQGRDTSPCAQTGIPRLLLGV